MGSKVNWVPPLMFLVTSLFLNREMLCLPRPLPEDFDRKLGLGLCFIVPSSLLVFGYRKVMSPLTPSWRFRSQIRMPYCTPCKSCCDMLRERGVGLSSSESSYSSCHSCQSFFWFWSLSFPYNFGTSSI